MGDEDQSLNAVHFHFLTRCEMEEVGNEKEGKNGSNILICFPSDNTSYGNEPVLQILPYPNSSSPHSS